MAFARTATRRGHSSRSAGGPWPQLLGPLPHIGEHLPAFLRTTPAVVLADRLAEELGHAVLDALIDAAPELFQPMDRYTEPFRQVRVAFIEQRQPQQP